ncbi:hypothetical protein Tco_1331316 [Tanacetum coccineum]
MRYDSGGVTDNPDCYLFLSSLSSQTSIRLLYPADEGDDDNDDDDDEDDDEEKEHLALADSFVVPVIDPVPSAKDTEAFETNESAPIPPSPRPCRARISVRLEPLMAAPMKACIAEYAVALTPPLPLPSPIYHLHSPRFPHHPSHYHHHLLLVLPMLRHCWATMQL